MNRIGRYLVVMSALLAAFAPTALARIQPQHGDSPDIDTAPTLVSYQGRVTVSGVPHNGAGFFKFAVVNLLGNLTFWSNDGTSSGGGEPTNHVPLSVSNGLFNVLLGDTSLSGMTQPLTAPVFNASDRYLRVWFATVTGGPYTLLAPDRRISSAPYALNTDMLDGLDSVAFAAASHNHFGQTWTGASGTGLTLSGGAIGLSGSGTTYGLSGVSALNGGVGVYGESTSTTFGYGVYGYATGRGVYGETDYSNGVGVHGSATATSGPTHGVRGEADSPAGVGVYGSALATSGFTHGVEGVTWSPTGVGVVGYANATTGLNYGAYGETSSDQGRGVVGHAIAASGPTYGIYGQSNSDQGLGVYGYAAAASGTTTGVYGQSNSTVGVGVYGLGRQGVVGETSSPDGNGVYGFATAATGQSLGVYGRSVSTSGWGVHGWAAATTGTTFGVFGRSDSTSPTAYGVYYTGGLGGTGTMAGIVETEDYGWRHLYAVEAPGTWFEDFGQARLVDGKATVTIEPIFAQTVNLAQPYHVFLTPMGDCPLYVAEKTPTSFTVRAHGGQTCDVAFDYRIIAKRLGYEELRLGPAQDPATFAPRAEPEEVPRGVRGR
jgi:hypothetical protein